MVFGGIECLPAWSHTKKGLSQKPTSVILSRFVPTQTSIVSVEIHACHRYNFLGLTMTKRKLSFKNWNFDKVIVLRAG